MEPVTRDKSNFPGAKEVGARVWSEDGNPLQRMPHLISAKSVFFYWKGLRFSTLQTFGSNNLSMMSMWSSHGISSSLSLTFCGKLPSNCPSNVSRLGPEDLELFGRNFDWKWCFLHNFMSSRLESYFWDWRRHWFLVIKRNVWEENQAYHK